jgi:hypothetical protein
MSKLAKLSFAFRLQDGPPKPQRPQVPDLHNPTTAKPMWKALLDKIMSGPWVDNSWATHINQPWTMDNLCYMYGVLQNGNLDPNAPGLCLPINIEAIPSSKGPWHLSHNLAKHKDGYIMVYLGVDEEGKSLSIPLHTILALAFHGPPEEIESDSDSDSDQSDDEPIYQEVGHVCEHPWCINPMHLVWCTHQENCRHHPPHDDDDEEEEEESGDESGDDSEE